MSRKGTDRGEFKEFYPSRELLEYLLYQIGRIPSGENVKIEIRLMRQRDFDSFWGRTGRSDGMSCYFGNDEQPRGYVLKKGSLSVTYCFRDSEKDRRASEMMDGLRKESALMLSVNSFSN